MDFASYARRAHVFDLQPLGDSELRKLARLLDRGASLVDAATAYARELGNHSPDVYQRAREVWREHLAWREHVRTVSSERLERGEQLLPDDAIRRTWSATDLRALERAASRFSPERMGTHARWHDAMVASASIWQSCLARALEEATVEPEPVGEDEEPPIWSAPPMSVDPIQWLKARSRQADGGLRLGFQLPEQALREEVQRHVGSLVPETEGSDEPDPETLLEELILGPMPEALEESLDRRAKVEAITEGLRRYLERLESRPFPGDRGRSVFLRGADEPVGLAVVERNGKPLGTTTVDPGTPVDEMLSWLSIHGADDDPVVLPAHGADAELSERLTANVPTRVPVGAIAPDGLPRRRAEDGEPDREQAAVDLAIRAFKPRRSWLALSADELELLGAEAALGDDGRERLHTALGDAATIVQQRQRRRDKKPAPRKEERARPSESSRDDGRLNPGIRRMSDLDEGLELQGRITDLNRMGAFVDVGIFREGLIPIGELTDGFADNPADVVRRGQQVRVRVKSVDRARRRFQLAFPQGGRPRTRGGPSRSR